MLSLVVLCSRSAGSAMGTVGLLLLQFDSAGRAAELCLSLGKGWAGGGGGNLDLAATMATVASSAQTCGRGNSL